MTLLKARKNAINSSIDLGTANTVILIDGKMVLDESSVIAVEMKTEKVVAIGKKANAMRRKTLSNIEVFQSVKDGVIADFRMGELMLKEMINKAILEYCL